MWYALVMEISVREAAIRLGVSPQRVRVLADAGRLPARKLGRDWLIDMDRAAVAAPGQREPGRPLSARSSWAILRLLAGKPILGVSRSERLRARERVSAIADAAPGHLASRADIHRLVVHRGLRERLSADPRIVLGGASAASHHHADLIALDELEGYARVEDLERLVREYALVPPAFGASANVLLRVPVPAWPFDEGERVAGRAVVAMDLIDAGDERSVRAGRILLVALAKAD